MIEVFIVVGLLGKICRKSRDVFAAGHAVISVSISITITRLGMQSAIWGGGKAGRDDGDGMGDAGLINA